MALDRKHYNAAERELERADEIANSDSGAWDLGPGRHAFVLEHLTRAQVHAQLAIVDATEWDGQP